YVHLGTGNYNSVTTKIYTDFGFFTCDENICADTSDLFNYLTGYSSQDNFRELLVAPINMREKLVELIEREIESHKKNGNGRLIFKMNSLTDPKMIQTLYKASSEGVKIDLLIRGMCCLRPNIKGISENIRVISIVGRFLEHARIFYFHNNGSDDIYLGSADLMERNLNRRVEILFPIKKTTLKQYLLKNFIEVQLNDNVNSQILLPNGHYEPLNHTTTETKIDCHKILLASSPTETCWGPN
ncbi:MAG: RNA degradosome polyphosphate kinase, partial [Ignavibacteria bacterium]|nr:RNA degradosome polyphosphate kinase [Ignavibacteria bacterium]